MSNMLSDREQIKRFYDDEIFRMFGGLLRFFRDGEEDRKDEVRVALQEILKRLPKRQHEYFYPWYCLLAALAADRLRFYGEGECFVRWDRHPSCLHDAHSQANRVWDEFWKQKPLPSLGTGVIEFLEEAKAVFVADCWHVIDPNEHERAETQQLWTLLNGISDNDEDRKACSAVYYELSSLLAAGHDDMLAPLEMIAGIELKDDESEDR